MEAGKKVTLKIGDKILIAYTKDAFDFSKPIIKENNVLILTDCINVIRLYLN